jgi:VWFA-related protein
MNRIWILKTALAVGLVFFVCMSFAPQWTAIIPFIHSAAADSDDAADNPGRENLPAAAISVQVDTVSMQVLVTDNNGNVITGLRPENFTIYEDGVKQTISHFSPMEANITVVMLVEFSRLTEIFLDDVYHAIYGFAHTLRPGDWTAVVGYDMHTTIFSDFTQSRQEVYSALRRFTVPSWSEINLHDAVIEIIDRTQELEGKVAILLISSGLHTFGRTTYDQALNAARNANASIFTIGIGGFIRDYINARDPMRNRGLISNSTNMDFLMGDNRLRSFSDFTGGAAFFPRYFTELPGIFDNISQALRNQYSIGYVSTNTKRDGRFRNIKVEVTTDLKDRRGNPVRPKVVTRRGYTAQSD